MINRIKLYLGVVPVLALLFAVAIVVAEATAAMAGT